MGGRSGRNAGGAHHDAGRLHRCAVGHVSGRRHDDTLEDLRHVVGDAGGVGIHHGHQLDLHFGSRELRLQEPDNLQDRLDVRRVISADDDGAQLG